MLYNNIDRGPGKNNISSCLAAYGPYGSLGPMALWTLWPFGPYGPLGPMALWTLWPLGPYGPLALWPFGPYGPLGPYTRQKTYDEY